MAERPYSDVLLHRLAKARRVAVMTGAGVSAESGIATFRDAGGVWTRFKPEELGTMEAFLGNPGFVQSWYLERKRGAESASPNEGHLALAAMEEIWEDFTLITQNVDNLHFRAGNRNVIELHGNITRSYCLDCRRTVQDEDPFEPSEDDPATCTACNGLLRPDVVWFGEILPADALEKAFQAACRADVFLSIGTSSVVYPAADIPVESGDYGAYVAEINIEASAIADRIDETVLGASGTVLPHLVESIRALR